MSYVLLSFPEIDVQLVGLVKVLIDPENIMIETAAVSAQQRACLSTVYEAQYWLRCVLLND